MKGEIPGCIPRIFPFVRHGNNMIVDHVGPLAIPYVAAPGIGEGTGAMFYQPSIQVEKVMLLTPQHPSERLTHDVRRIRTHPRGSNRTVELVRLAEACLERCIGVLKWCLDLLRRDIC